MISLYFINGKAYVWNAEDWLLLRKTYRIVGELFGSIAPIPRHEGFQGLPMGLTTEETALLVEEGHCNLIESTSFHKPPDQDQCAMVANMEKRIYSEQLQCMKEKRAEQLSSKIDMIIAGKKRKMAMKGQIIELDREILMEEELLKLPPLSEGHTLVQIPTEHPWPYETKIVNINALSPSISSEMGRVKFAIFRDLWNKGYHITAGVKFGGDFLVYPGDPVKFHAMYIVKCLTNPQQELTLSSIVAFGRLGVSVNKLTVFAYLNSENTVIYQTLQWHKTLIKNAPSN